MLAIEGFLTCGFMVCLLEEDTTIGQRRLVSLRVKQYTRLLLLCSAKVDHEIAINVAVVDSQRHS
jgi:hypothetical protein